MFLHRFRSGYDWCVCAMHLHLWRGRTPTIFTVCEAHICISVIISHMIFLFLNEKKNQQGLFLVILKNVVIFFFFFRGRGGKWFEPSTFQHSFGIIMKSLELYENYQNMTRKRKLIYEVGKFFPLIYSLGAATNQRNICEAQQNWFCWVYIFFYFIFQLRTYWCTYILGRV